MERLGVDVTRVEMVPTFVALLQDGEAEVRTAAAFNSTSFADAATGDSAHAPAAVLQRAIERQLAARTRRRRTVIVGLAPVVGRDTTIEHLLPLFLQLLNDEFPEVRLNIISTLHVASTVIGVEQLSHSLLPAITDLAQDRQWRVRMAIIDSIPKLASQLGVAFFDEKLRDMCLGWLQDCVFAIREAAIANVCRLVEVFGMEWGQQQIIPQVFAAHTHTNYLYRMTVLYAMPVLAPTVGADFLAGTMLPWRPYVV